MREYREYGVKETGDMKKINEFLISKGFQKLDGYATLHDMSEDEMSGGYGDEEWMDNVLEYKRENELVSIALIDFHPNSYLGTCLSVERDSVVVHKKDFATVYETLAALETI